MSNIICKLFGHRYIPYSDAALLRALSWDRDAKFCDRCGSNTVKAL